MSSKKLMQATAVVLYMVSLNSFAAQDFSALSTAELTQLKFEEMGEEDHSAFRAEIQKRSMKTGTAEKEESGNQKREQKRGQGGGQGRGGAQGGMGRGH